jgi:hypothetical protein
MANFQLRLKQNDARAVQSQQSADMGSMVEARRAGIAQAMAATPQANTFR